MLLTDPLAPRQVATAFIAAAALTVGVLPERVAPGTLFPWLGAHRNINSSNGLLHDITTLQNAAVVSATD